MLSTHGFKLETMEQDVIFMIVMGVFLLLVIVSQNTDNSDNEEDYQFDDRCSFKEEEKEEQFYHPTTGYKGTRSEMDTYIINRERRNNERK